MPDTARFRPPGPLGFGGAPLGNMFAPIPEATAEAVLEAAWESGIRFYDTAPHYGAGLSEHRFGHMLRQRPREDYVLSTKVGRMLHPDPAAPREYRMFRDPLPFRVEYDYSADAALRSVEDSLQRLGLARIDIALIHDIAEDTHGAEWERVFDAAMAGAAPALTRLREEGVIRAWGLGVNRPAACLRALERADPDLFLIAGRYTLLDQGALAALLPACLRRGVAVIIGGPFNSGLLAGGGTFDYREAPPERVAARDRLAALCARHGVDLRAAALQFAAAHPAVAAVIPGAVEPAQVRANAALMRTPIPPALWQEMRAAGLLPPEAPTP